MIHKLHVMMDHVVQSYMVVQIQQQTITSPVQILTMVLVFMQVVQIQELVTMIQQQMLMMAHVNTLHVRVVRTQQLTTMMLMLP
jgi:hypothetical protein